MSIFHQLPAFSRHSLQVPCEILQPLAYSAEQSGFLPTLLVKSPSLNPVLEVHSSPAPFASRENIVLQILATDNLPARHLFQTITMKTKGIASRTVHYRETRTDSCVHGWLAAAWSESDAVAFQLHWPGHTMHA